MGLRVRHFPASVISWMTGLVAQMQRSGGAPYGEGMDDSVDGTRYQCSCDMDGTAMKVLVFREENTRLQLENRHRMANETYRKAALDLKDSKAGLTAARREKSQHPIDDQKHIDLAIERLEKQIQEQTPIEAAAKIDRDALALELKEWSGFEEKVFKIKNLGGYFFNLDQGAGSEDTVSIEAAFEIVRHEIKDLDNRFWHSRVRSLFAGKMTSERELTLDEAVAEMRKHIDGPDRSEMIAKILALLPDDEFETEETYADLRVRDNLGASDQNSDSSPGEPGSGGAPAVSGQGAGGTESGSSDDDGQKANVQAGAERLQSGDPKGGTRKPGNQ